nr:retrovirus-related Pol polyprotein from transposon TNT 1-94 [Tanacetum cinerariifolium]
MVPPNNLGPDLSGKSINKTQYRGMIRSLMYLTANRPNIKFSTCLCARYQANPKESLIIVVKRFLRYRKGTPSLGLWYLKCSGFDLKGYSDSDYAGCNMDRKSTSATEAEYVVAAGCCANILWLKSQLTDYDIIYEKVTILCDNTSAIAISNNPVMHSITKHIDIRYHFIRDHVLKGNIELHFIPTQYQLVDIFTKPLDESTFKRLIVELGGVRVEISITTFRNAFREQYLPHSSGKTGGLDQISNKDATILYSLATGVQVDYVKIIYEDLIHKMNKKTKENIVPYPRFLSLLLEHMMPEYENEELTINLTQVFSVYNLTLKPNQHEEPSFTDHIKAIYNLDVHVDSKAPKPSLQAEEASKSQTRSKKETKSSSAKEKSLSHRSPPTSLRVTSEEGAYPQLSSGMSAFIIIELVYLASFICTMSLHQGMDEGTKNYSFDHIFAGSNPSVLVDKIKSAEDRLKTTHTNLYANEESKADDILLKVKLEDLSDILKDTRSAFFTPDSLPDEPIIVLDESEDEKEVAKDKDTKAPSYDVPKDTSVPHPPSLKLAQIQELMAQVHLLLSHKEELEQAKAKAKVEVATIKAKPSYSDIHQLTELLVAELMNIQWELPAEFLNLPSQVSSV